MKKLRQLYRFLFERGCIDYSEPYQEQKVDTDIDNWRSYNKIITDTPKITWQPYVSALTGYLYTTNPYNTIGYHNSRL